MRGFEIRSADLCDIQEIVTLMNSVFGVFPRAEEMLTKWILEPIYSVNVAFVDEKIVGVCTWHRKTDGDYSKYEIFGPQVSEFLRGRKSAWILNLVLHPDHRRQGIGKKLALAHGEWLRRSGCEVVVGTSWVNGSDDNSQHLYRVAGFRSLGESTEFLRDQLNGSICAVCGPVPCRCNSIFFGVETERLLQFIEGTSGFTESHPE